MSVYLRTSSVFVALISKLRGVLKTSSGIYFIQDGADCFFNIGSSFRREWSVCFFLLSHAVHAAAVHSFYCARGNSLICLHVRGQLLDLDAPIVVFQY